MSSLIKTKASSLAKVAALPRLRSPADLYNEYTQPYDLQKKLMNGQQNQKDKYISDSHYELIKNISTSRNQYRNTIQQTIRQTIAKTQVQAWNNYLLNNLNNKQIKLTQRQKEQIYQSLLIAKERNQQRLALNRFIKFGYQYSQAFKVDIPLNPTIIMKLVHPHFGYFNNLPNLNKYKYTHQQIYHLIEELNFASSIRQKGYILHSSELLSFIFWKILTANKPTISTNKFIDHLKVFKFNNITSQNFNQQFSYSLRQGQIRGDKIRFDLFRQIFIDRQL